MENGHGFISEITARTQTTLVRGAMSEAGVEKKNKLGSGIAALNAIGEDKVMALLLSGITYEKIAMELGCTIGEVSIWLASDDRRAAKYSKAKSMMHISMLDSLKKEVEELADDIKSGLAAKDIDSAVVKGIERKQLMQNLKLQREILTVIMKAINSPTEKEAAGKGKDLIIQFNGFNNDNMKVINPQTEKQIDSADGT